MIPFPLVCGEIARYCVSCDTKHLHARNSADLVGADHVLAVLADLFSLLFGLGQLGCCFPQFFFSFLHKEQHEQEIIQYIYLIPKQGLL